MSTIVGLFDTYRQADQAVDALEHYGMDRGKISVIQRDGEKTLHDNMDAGKGAVAGATTGGADPPEDGTAEGGSRKISSSCRPV